MWLLDIAYGTLEEIVNRLILVDSLLSGLVECPAVRSKPENIVAITSGFAHFQASSMCRVIDAEHINQF